MAFYHNLKSDKDNKCHIVFGPTPKETTFAYPHRISTLKE